MNSNKYIAQANQSYKSGDYQKALNLYQKATLKYPVLVKTLQTNIILTLKKLKNIPQYNEKIIIYTVNIGNYESIKEPLFIDPRIEYILFTDNKNIKSKNWKVITIDSKLSDSRRISRLPKILAHKYLPEHDISIYIDSSLQIKTLDIYKIVSECMEGKDIALYKHYRRNCVYDEIKFVMNSTDRVVVDKEKCKKAIKKYEMINYPKENGVFENAFIFRRNTKKIKELNELWWDEYQEGTERDQFVLMYALHKLSIQVNSIKIGNNFRDNPFVDFHKHIYRPSINTVKKNIDNNFTLLKIETTKENEKNASVNWIVGGADNAGWAYENNAKRFISEQSQFKHYLQSRDEVDIAIYFDILLYDRMPMKSKQSIIRIGGPRPLDRLCGNDIKKLKTVIEKFHSVICLNQELMNRLKEVHPNVHLIPNGLALEKFSPTKLSKRINTTFTIGFAGSVKSSTERQVKGLDLVIEASKLLKVNLLNIGRGKGQVQVPHEKMIKEFYSQIDVLVHPVDAGREGSSNVIMEALALGIPVITTKFSGYHAENLIDRENFLLCKRNIRSIAGKIRDIKENSLLANQLVKSGRIFAEKHHNIKNISKKYEVLIAESLKYQKADIKISFNSFWYPVENFATGRIRSIYPSKLLDNSSKVVSKLGYDQKADIVFISQLASDELMEAINRNKNQFIIYDLCDKYYEDEREVGGVNAKSRFYEIVRRANLVITSTLELKKDLYSLNINKPIVYIPDGMDFKDANLKKYIPFFNQVTTIGWFGNTGRGNLDSSVWLLEEALLQGKKIKLITRKKSMNKYPKLYKHTVDWDYSTFIQELQTCDVIVVTHSSEEQNKSPNRLLTAVKNGVPVIVSSSKSCAEILHNVGLSWAIVQNKKEFENALALLSNSKIKDMYFKLLSPYIEQKYGDITLKKNYNDLINNYTYPLVNNNFKILFVSHNLSIGEGAPTSLFQTVVGLKKFYTIEPHVFCPMTGDFKTKYEEQNIPIYNYTKIISKDSLKPLNASFTKAKQAFQDFLEKEKFDLVVCNTAKMLPYADFAIEKNIPAISIIRESSDEHIDITFSKNKQIIDASKHALLNIKEVVFVSDVTRQTWKQRQYLPRTQVIHNGIITAQWDYLKQQSKQNLKVKLNLPTDKIIMLSVGTINKRKAQIDIINAYQMLPYNLIKESYLVLVGARDSGYLELLKQEIQKLPKIIKDNILLVPETNNVGEWYKASNIFVFASHNESYPRVIVEALYFGLDIISSKVFGVSEQLGNNKNASIYEIGDIISLSHMMEIRLKEFDAKNIDSDHFYTLTTYQEMLSKYFSIFTKTIIENKNLVSNNE